MTPRVRFVVALAIAITGCRGSAKTETRAPTTVVTASARERFEAGIEHMDAGAPEYEAALQDFRAAVEATPDLWEAWLNIGVIELRRARLGAAAQAFERSVEIYPSPEALEGLGEVYLRQGRAAKAVDLYERALAKDPDDTRLRVRLAVSLRHAGKLDAAEAEARAALGRDTGEALAYATMAAIHLDREQLELAELVLRRGLEKNPDHPALLTNLGLVALARGDDQTAFGLFDQASKVDPAFLTGRLDKAAVYLGAGNHEKAQEEFRFVLQIEPGNTQALLGLGVAQRLSGDAAAARETWEQVLAVDADNAAAHFNLGVLAMDQEEKPADAKKHLERYVQLAAKDDPRVERAKERLALLAALGGEKS